MHSRSLKNSNISTFSISFDELKHDASDIFTILGYADGEAPEHLHHTFKEVVSEAGQYCEIRAGLDHFTNIARLDDHRFRIGSVEFDIGKTISVQLRKAESIAIFVCTIGSGLEKWSKQLMNEGDFFKGYMVDAIASQTVELAIDKVQHHLENEFEAEDLKLTNRYSPGYCGWHVSEQHKLFSLLPEDFCGIQLSESSLMLPIKSVSGIIGIGSNVRKMDYTCRLCEMSDCVYRRRFEKIPQDA